MIKNKISIVVILLACCGIAMADGASSLVNTDYSWLDGLDTGLLDVDLTTDLSAALLSSIFGNFSGMLPTVSQGAGGLISLLFGYFNKGLFMIAGLLVTYSAVLSTIKTSEEGKTMGERAPIAWSIFRPVLGTSILVPVYNGYSVLQTFLMWATLSGVGLANSIWTTTIETFNTYGNLGYVTSSISDDASTSYGGAASLVQDLFNSQMCFYSARQEYAKGKVAIDVAQGITTTQESNYTGTTTCSSAIDKESPCYEFHSGDHSVKHSKRYTLSYHHLPEGYDCGGYHFRNKGSIYSATSMDTSGDFWSGAETLLYNLVYTSFGEIDDLAFTQFNGYYAIANDTNSTSDDIKDYFTGSDGQCISSTDCLLASSLATAAISFQNSLQSALSVAPYTQSDAANNQISGDGGWILAATSYYQLVAKGNSYTLKVSPAATLQRTSINNITVPRSVSDPRGQSDFTTNSNDYAKVNENLAIAVNNIIVSSTSASIMSSQNLGYTPNTKKFKMGRVQYSGEGTDLYEVIASEIYYAGINMFTDTSTKRSYDKKMETLTSATKNGLDTTSATTSATGRDVHKSTNWWAFGLWENTYKKEVETVTTAVNLEDSGAQNIDLTHMPNGGLRLNSLMKNFGFYSTNTHYAKIIDKQINWFIAKILITWQKYFLTSNVQDPVTAARNFGFSVVEQSGTFLIYAAIEAFKFNMQLLAQYMAYFIALTFVSGSGHNIAGGLFNAASKAFEVIAPVFPPFTVVIAYVVRTVIIGVAFPFKVAMEPLAAGAAAAQILLLQMSMAYTYLWLPILFGATVPLMVLGLILSVYAPMIPFLIFLLASINWIIGVIEAMVAAPVVALGIAHPVGHDVLGRAELCMMLIFAVMIRPAAMVFGFIFAVILCYVAFPLFNYIFLYFMQTFFAHAILNIGGKGASISIFFALALYCYVILNFITQAFSMIYVIPNKVMRWIGVPVDRADEEQWLEEVKGGVEDAAGKLSKGATETPSQTASASDTLGGMQAGREEMAGFGSLKEGGKK